MAVIGSVSEYFSSVFTSGSLTSSIFILAIVITIASLFIFEFYKSISRRNLIKLNLKKYNTSDHPFFGKIFAMLLYLLEYIIIMPFLILLWFSGLAIVLLLIAQERLIGEVLWITAAMIGAIRILAYIKSDLSRELAKLFPFITLSVFILSWDTLDYSKILAKVYEIPALFNQIFSFIFVVLIIEVALRLIFEAYDFWSSEGGREEAYEEVSREMHEAEIQKLIKRN